MQQILITLIGIMLTATTLYGQRPTRDEAYDKSYAAVNKAQSSKEAQPWRHDIRVGVSSPGLLSTIFISSTLNEPNASYNPSTSTALANERYYNTPTYYLPGATIEYGQRLKPWLMVGGKASFAMTWSSRRHVYTDEILYRDNCYAIGLLLNFRFDWLRRDVVRLYSSIGIGIASRIAFDNNLIVPMYDATYFGMSLGRSVYGFAEIGAGISGSLRAGIGVRF